MLKYFKIGRYGLVALISISCSVVLRLVLLVQGWPLTNSDEATMGLMARDIAYRGQHPIFFYGQHYMGALEAYIAAIAFHMFGSSLFTLRAGLVLLFACFLLSTYLLTSMLYSKAWGCVVVTLLGPGSSFVLARELSAIGGYPETLLFGSLALLLTTKLALTSQSSQLLICSPTYNRFPRSDDPCGRGGTMLRWLLEHRERRQSQGSSLRGEHTLSLDRLLRSAGYAGWGLVIGLGLWSDLLIAPFALCSALLLLVCCWNEMTRPRAVLCALLGVIVGGFPLLLYNLTAAPGQDSLSVLWQIQHSSNGYLLTHFGQQISGTVQVSIPMMTGEPFCLVPERLEPGPMSSLPCILARSSWGVGYIVLFAFAFIMALKAIGRSYRRLPGEPGMKDASAWHAFVIASARLLLLSSALITLLLYATGGSPVDWPGSRARYLIGLLIATPAILWPLWYGIRRGYSQLNKASLQPFWIKGVYTGTILAVTALLIVGTIQTFDGLPATQQANRRQQALIDHLIQIGATHIYSDYWTCNRLAFASNERIICGVVEQDLQRSKNFNRDAAYYPLVSADPHAAYVFSIHTPLSQVALRTTLPPERYNKSIFAQYVIYQPRA